MDLEKWNNPNKYPILVTATCTFAGYDDPKEITAGEYSLVLPDKGAISLFTTTRVVYANSNDRLRSEEHTSELQSRGHLVCRLLLEKKKQATLEEANERITDE